jgi:hypothetical protein
VLGCWAAAANDPPKANRTAIAALRIDLFNATRMAAAPG